jgi:hypothetical protein
VKLGSAAITKHTAARAAVDDGQDGPDRKGVQ